MDVEHFFPKNEYPELRYEWTNLYPADHDANMMKPNKVREGGYLDPCNPNDDVENDIFYWLDFENQKCHFKATDPQNIKAVNTAFLLDKLHNGDKLASIQKTADLRFALFKRRDMIAKTIIAWKDAKLNNNKNEEIRQELKLRAYLSRESSFTMLMRSISTVKKYIPKDFLD